MQTASTNADMRVLAGEGAPEGLWLRAETQTGGKGRLDRAWESPPGNLYCSTLVRLQANDPPPATLALVAAVAVWRTVNMMLPGRVQIKWPNDILIGPAKLSGMLLERVGDAILLGIGINIMAHPDLPDRLTTSLWSQGAVDATPADVLEQLSRTFHELLMQWRSFGLDPIRTLWLQAAHPRGTPLKVNLPDGMSFKGQFHSLDSSGALILDQADGGSRTIHAGDVFLL
ncbi:biotin--[acetyl-CoA-carboxylase] ligase [Sphingobium sp. SCG-1]|uniref:biotin--[acetyl-CoA-carboxylase] ligase n=1 Tax=Sphingobium sp. SCG-1 TaxID=2072936 RepID=UPI0021D52A76|nr:biotin--[acetyl-CoA-carboxylase] ligase [Sphingobium sp. SCG-1]